ncbi:unnamed protein product [Cuscuta campestris]|uniref:Uncharacterized protein n=1 Tax=Cuscuta campestris TaxID=132261 RepID=A0A484LJZ1_9ASTE|nr:unnamed protein product [Cuscuta campestris]
MDSMLTALRRNGSGLLNNAIFTSDLSNDLVDGGETVLSVFFLIDSSLCSTWEFRSATSSIRFFLVHLSAISPSILYPRQNYAAGGLFPHALHQAHIRGSPSTPERIPKETSVSEDPHLWTFHLSNSGHVHCLVLHEMQNQIHHYQMQICNSCI